MARFAVLGAAAALAMSGKYVGALVVPITFVPVFGLQEERGRKALVLLAAFVVVLLFVNFPIFASLESFLGSLGREINFSVHGQKDLTRSVPHGFYGPVFRGATNPAIWILLGIYYVRFFTFLRRVHPAERMLALFPILYVVILSCLPKTNHRYFLPGHLDLLHAGGFWPLLFHPRGLGAAYSCRSSGGLSGGIRNLGCPSNPLRVRLPG